MKFLKLGLILLSVFSLNAESNTKSFEQLRFSSPKERSIMFFNFFQIRQNSIKKTDITIREYEQGLITSDSYIDKLVTIYQESKTRQPDCFLKVIEETSRWCYFSKTLSILGLISEALDQPVEREPLYPKSQANVSLKSKSFLPSISKTCSSKKNYQK